MFVCQKLRRVMPGNVYIYEGILTIQISSKSNLQVRQAQSRESYVHLNLCVPFLGRPSKIPSTLYPLMRGQRFTAFSHSSTQLSASMDEAFWSNVVKRWSEASETVIILKKELAKVQGEVCGFSIYVGDLLNTFCQCELYRDVVQNLRGKNLGVNEASRFRASAGVHARQESGRTIVVDEDHASTLRDELKDAEIGLGRAKDEYRRLQKEVCLSLSLVFILHDSLFQLAEATVKIRAVTAENTRLLSNQAQESIAAHERNQMQKELNDIRSENQKLIDKVGTWSVVVLYVHC